MAKERDVIREFLATAPNGVKIMLRDIEAADPLTEETVTIGCGNDPCGIDGAKQVRCSDCNAIAWISPSTQEALAERGDRPTRFLCMLCLIAEMKKLAEEDED